MAKTAVTKKALTYLLGVCVPSSKGNTAKIRIRRLDFDNHLIMYFSKCEFLYAADPNKLAKTGDTVLIQSLPKKLTRVISHKVVEVVYPLGDIIDPISGERIVSGRYRKHVEDDAELFGKLDSMYEYDKMPKRGSMEDKRDFSNQETRIKYHDDPNDTDPYTVNPF